MLLKKLLLEFGTLAGLVGGGAGGIASSSQKSIEFSDGDYSIFFSENSSTLVRKKKVNTDLKKRNSLISQLNYSVLNYWKWQSEGVGENFLFINGWDKAGKPIEIKSETHSQRGRELWGGRLITFSNYDGGWFGPRDLTKIWRDLEKSKEITKGKSYWPLIQESKNYLTQKDWEELSMFWSKRSKDLEEDIFGLWKGREYWAKQFGTKDGKVDLEFKLNNLGKILNSSEEDLKNKGWKYGELVSNSFLDRIRYFGDLEGTAFNYLRKTAWEDDTSTKKLKERNVAKVIGKLIYGEEMGFKCNREDADLKSKYFKECENNQKAKLGNFELVYVLKATNYSDSSYKVPEKGKGTSWKNHPSLSEEDKKKLINFEKIENSTLIFEKCEESSLFDLFDPNKKIRQEACERLLNPWFGDSVEDKRLCLFQSSENNYLLRLINYIKVITIPTWHNKNTFWTKCSNFGI